MRRYSRRTFGLWAAAAGGLSALPASAQPPAPTAAPAATLRIRRDISTLSPNDDNLVAFRIARTAMLKRTDGLSWARQVSVHAGMHNQHNSWFFLPWHRAQLNYFEQIVAKLSGHAGFALPYLNWDNDHIPPIFFDRKDVFFHAARRPGLSPAMSISQFAAIQGLGQFRDLSRGEYDGFDDLFGTGVAEPGCTTEDGGPCAADYGGDAETFGHNLMHNFVGGKHGDMADIETAPNDPLFFFHHANVDRLWAQWARETADCVTCGTSSAADYNPDWLTQSVSGYVNANGAPAGPVPIQSLLSTHGLGYAYDNIAVLLGAGAPSFGPHIPDQVESLRFKRRSATSIELTLPQALGARRRKIFDKFSARILLDLAEAPATAVRAVVRVHDGPDAKPLATDGFFMVSLGRHNHNLGYGFQAKNLLNDVADDTLKPRLVVTLEAMDAGRKVKLPPIAKARLAYSSTEAKPRS